MLLCRKCNTPFLDDMPWSQPHHPRADMQALRSNFLPSLRVVSQIKALARAEKSDLEHLEETIKCVQDTLRELQNRKDTLRQEIQRRESFFAPIRRLPVEVLQTVFKNVSLGNGRDRFSLDVSKEIESEDDCESCGTPHCEVQNPRKITIATPFSVSQVCSHWRSVAVGTPSLWASLSLDVMGNIDEGHADLVDLYLQRSAQYPLKVALVDGDDGDDDIGETGFDVLCAVVKELYRCKEFHYEADVYYLINLIDKPFQPQALPLLTTFSDRADPHLGDDDGWLWDLVKVAPNLVDVSVTWFTGRDSFPKNLRSLTIREQKLSYTPFLQMIPRLPKLVSLNLDDFSPRYGTPLTPYPIYTRDLVITSSMTLSGLDPLFSSVSLPILSSLDISTNGPAFDPVTYNLGALRALIQRSGCSLKELTLDIQGYSSGALISLLELQPSLVRLKLEVRVPHKASPADLEEPLVLADLFTRLSLPDPQSPLIPRIQHLDIREVVVSASDYGINERFKIVESALDMVELRVGHGGSGAGSDISLTLDFDRVRISYKNVKRPYTLPVDLEKRVEGLNARGVKCCVSFSTPPL
ncbi:hypothetical protein VNI00_002119 [Paramarasmius palmivorus]|uniref:F-box domain-containing protein n=1 Tax=Paramarasmius palmivorus TaxID=297713 RepID=A0AAW0E260_9AGAR